MLDLNSLQISLKINEESNDTTEINEKRQRLGIERPRPGIRPDITPCITRGIKVVFKSRFLRHVNFSSIAS